MFMKKKILCGICLLAIASAVFFTANKGAEKENDSLLSLMNLEALANDEYVIGPVGSNWRTYTTECTRTIGFDYILKIEITTTYWAEVCGSGSGWCLSPAGC